MKRWMWETSDDGWEPIIVCPYCSTACSPIVMHLFTRCPLCRKRVYPPKKDYWESMKEKEGETE